MAKTATKAAPKAAAPKSEAPAKAATKTKAVKAAPSNGAAGRPASDETIAFRKQILKLAKKGISNPDLADKLGVDTMKSQSLANSLIKMGKLTKEKDGIRNVYTTVTDPLA